MPPLCSLANDGTWSPVGLVTSVHYLTAIRDSLEKSNVLYALRVCSLHTPADLSVNPPLYTYCTDYSANLPDLDKLGMIANPIQNLNSFSVSLNLEF